MVTRDLIIKEKVEGISQQWATLHGNSFIRNALAAIEIPYQFRVALDLVTHVGEAFHLEGFSLDDLYLAILGLSNFIYTARVEIYPHLSRKVSSSRGPDSILERMAADNMKANLGDLADRVSELYVLTVNWDKKHNPKRPFSNSFPELKSVGQLLTSESPGLLRQ